LLGAVVMAGCAAPMLAKEKHDWMLERYQYWKPSISFYAPVAKAAYRDSVKPPPGFSPPTVIDVPRPGKDPSTAYIFRTDDAQRKHFIGIEGTRDAGGLRLDAEAVLHANPTLMISVHPGFDADARAVYGDIQARNLLKPGYSVGLTGHSLGGAAAVVLAMYLDHDNIVVDEVVTFGQPRVTDHAGLMAFNRVMERTVRVVACDDVIPFVPPIGYEHGGAVLLLLDPARFEFASQDIDRPFAVALRNDFKNTPFHGHRMDTYLDRLEKPRTDPWLYTNRDAKYCSGL